MRIVVNPNFLQEITAEIGPADLEARAAAVADACNRDSSWGGYYSGAGSDGTVRVWSADARSDEARDQRLLRNLDAAR